MAYLSEEEHEKYLKMHLKYFETAPKESTKKLIRYTKDSLEIARSVGYESLYNKYNSLFKKYFDD